MSNKLQYHHIPTHTPEWYDFRENGIGGSEIGAVMNHNGKKWKSAIEVFYEKVGLKPIDRDYDNEKMFHGRNLEDYIANLWQYWGGDKATLMDNYKAGNVVRKASRVNAYVVNPKYPHLFASLDRRIHKGQMNLLTLEANPGNGILECKQLSEYASKVWKDKIPPSYVMQVQDYMMITETEYAEIAVLMDGNNFEVYPLEASPILQEQILHETTEFWDGVVKARKAKTEYEAGQLPYDDFQGIIQEHEPEPDHSEAYKDFMNEQYAKEKDEIELDEETPEHLLMRKDKLLHGIIKVLTSKRQLVQNTLIKTHVDFQTEYLKIMGKGYSRYYQRSNASKKQLDNKLKNDYDFDEIAEKIVASIHDKIESHGR